MTRTMRIYQMFTDGVELSCDNVVRKLISDYEPTHSPHGYRYLSGSVSSVLKRFVDGGKLEYSYKKTSRGGHIYKLKPV